MIRFENVGMRYGLGPEVLRDVTFDLQPGTFHILTGASGAGKTSLLKLMYLAHRPSRGMISMFGHDLASLPRKDMPLMRRRIGVIFQEFRLLEHLTAFENVALPLRIANIPPQEYEDDVRELLIWVGLKDRIEARPPTLSGGEKQRVAIARAVVAKPDLILADEPTGNVDPAMGRRLLHLFLELNELGTTVLVATHDTMLVEEVGGPNLHIEAGRLTQLASSSRPIAAPRGFSGLGTLEPEDDANWGGADWSGRRLRGASQGLHTDPPFNTLSDDPFLEDLNPNDLRSSDLRPGERDPKDLRPHDSRPYGSGPSEPQSNEHRSNQPRPDDPDWSRPFDAFRPQGRRR